MAFFTLTNWWNLSSVDWPCPTLSKELLKIAHCYSLDVVVITNIYRSASCSWYLNGLLELHWSISLFCERRPTSMRSSMSTEGIGAEVSWVLSRRPRQRLEIDLSLRKLHRGPLRTSVSVGGLTVIPLSCCEARFAETPIALWVYHPWWKSVFS